MPICNHACVTASSADCVLEDGLGQSGSDEDADDEDADELGPLRSEPHVDRPLPPVSPEMAVPRIRELLDTIQGT